MKSVVDQTATVRADLSGQKSLASTNGQINSAEVRKVDRQITLLQHDMKNLENGTLSGSSRAHNAKSRWELSGFRPIQSHRRPCPSYVRPINKQIQQMASLYKLAVQDPSNVDSASFSQAVSHAQKVRSEANHMYQVMSTTPYFSSARRPGSINMVLPPICTPSLDKRQAR
jgi:hypothetical protein